MASGVERGEVGLESELATVDEEALVLGDECSGAEAKPSGFAIDGLVCRLKGRGIGKISNPRVVDAGGGKVAVHEEFGEGQKFAEQQLRVGVRGTRGAPERGGGVHYLGRGRGVHYCWSSDRGGSSRGGGHGGGARSGRRNSRGRTAGRTKGSR